MPKATDKFCAFTVPFSWTVLGWSNSFSDVHSAINVAFKMNVSTWNDGIAQPFVSNSLQIRSIPSPNSLTYLYALRDWAIFGLREKCVWWIFYGAPISCLRVKLLKIIGINADMLKNKNKRAKMRIKKQYILCLLILICRVCQLLMQRLLLGIII